MQQRVLVAYATRAGSTEEVAQTLADVLRKHGMVVDVCRARDLNSLVKDSLQTNNPSIFALES